MHNVYPIRGAEVRDANAWARYLNEALDRFGTRYRRGLRPAPLAGLGHTSACSTIWASSAMRYKYLHDQTVRLMNHGYKADEIAERLALPESLAQHLARARLLRHAQPQREGGLSALPRLVRRQPRPSQSRCRRSSGGASTSSTWAARRRSSSVHGRTSRGASTASSPRR